ncbi:replication factor C large subunit [Candidatus Woesearchaeota archaeon]|nr:replication factor C large subunit [Candidatus Woesearchaeota archaeon]
MRVLPWIKKYIPTAPEEVVGQDVGVQRLLSYVKEFSKGCSPMLLHGPPGTGKTSAVYAVAESLDLEVIELNASDARNKAAINDLLGAALGQHSLFFKGKVILVDEADGLSGTKDRGGVPALLALVKNSSFPIVITANDAGSKKLKAVKKASESVEFASLAPKDITLLLQGIAKKEGIDAEEQALTAIARRVGGDARAAVNDLQTLSDGKKITMQELDALGDREQKEVIEQALLRIFKTTSADVALPAFDNVDANINELFLWIDQNLPKEYSKPEDLARAYDALAEADRFFGRIRRWQYYRFYVYIYNLLTAGIALAKDEKYPGAPKYKRSSRPLMIWMANQRNAKKKAIAEKLGAATHASRKRATEDVMFFKPVFQKGGQTANAIADALDLDEDELAWMEKH